MKNISINNNMNNLNGWLQTRFISELTAERIPQNFVLNIFQLNCVYMSYLFVLIPATFNFHPYSMSTNVSFVIQCYFASPSLPMVCRYVCYRDIIAIKFLFYYVHFSYLKEDVDILCPNIKRFPISLH